MAETNWEIEGLEYANCNCSYGCPCQFNALPTYGNCKGVFGYVITKGHHGTTTLDGLRVAGVFRFPGALHEGHGEVTIIVDERANAAQRDALVRILTGKDAAPGTFFHILASMTETLNPTVFAAINFEVDVDRRRAKLFVPNCVEARGEPILNPVTGSEHRVRIDMPEGFEYRLAEIGRGWAKTEGQIALEIADSYAQFIRAHLNQDGVVN